ncbi:hypothetical protein CDL15_Pgr002553 [Punica granatum]|uniref:Uncharacterized protein n=1 Tax=Punica granatum TaxID=22663 RepID=A0A218VZ73_PUNGR|nr:hypothetical protein CDL15_Pgr002553 [Punica granatum]
MMVDEDELNSELGKDEHEHPTLIRRLGRTSMIGKNSVMMTFAKECRLRALITLFKESSLSTHQKSVIYPHIKVAQGLNSKSFGIQQIL